MITNDIKNLHNLFQKEGFEIRLVGGCVRDYLRNVEPKDIDFCTNATPDEMIDIASKNAIKVIPTGLQHGTVTFVINDENYEITTLRIDVETDGRHAEVQFTRSFEQDAARRDLTINAMSMDVNGNIYDYFNGQEDLKNNQVNFVGDFEKRIEEDYLRIFRYIRFTSIFGGYVNRDIIDHVIDNNIEGIRSISVERIWAELKKTHLTYTGVQQAVINILNKIYPGVFRQMMYSFWDGNPMVNISRMIDNIDYFADTFKISSEERNILQVIRDIGDTDIIVKKNSIINNFLKKNQNVDEWVIKYLQTHCSATFKTENGKVVPFKLPYDGKELIKRGVKPGVHMGKILSFLTDKWEQIHFELTREQIEVILDKFEDLNSVKFVFGLSTFDVEDFEFEHPNDITYRHHYPVRMIHEDDCLRLGLSGKEIKEFY